MGAHDGRAESNIWLRAGATGIMQSSLLLITAWPSHEVQSGLLSAMNTFVERSASCESTERKLKLFLPLSAVKTFRGLWGCFAHPNRLWAGIPGAPDIW